MTHNLGKFSHRSWHASMSVALGLGLGFFVLVSSGGGNIGSSDRINYTLVGDAVNVAQRIEEAGKTLGEGEDDVAILISGTVQGNLVDTFDVVHLGPQQLRGRKEQIEVYGLRSLRR